MDRLSFLAAHSASEIMKAQAISANNLANASTSGFRAELAHYSSELVKPSEGIDTVIRGLSVSSSPSLRSGQLQSTGRDLDVAVNGRGFIAVQTPEGTEGYTRRGDLLVDSVGQVTNSIGQPVIGNSGPIVLPPYSTLEIGTDGSISLVPLGQDPNSLAVVDRIKMVLPENPSELVRGDDGLIRLDDEFEILPADASVSLTSGTLETSNVNAMGSLLQMIELGRQFEGHVKMMETSRDNAQALNQIMRLR